MCVIATGPLVAAYGIQYEAKFIDHISENGELPANDLRYEVYIETQLPLDRPRTWKHQTFLCDNFIDAARYFNQLIGETLDAYEGKWSI